MPYETKLNRQLLGLPPVEPRPPANENQANANQGEQRQGNARNAARAQGGILGMLQTVIDALEQDEEADGHRHIDDIQIDFRAEERIVEDDGEQDEGLMLEVIVEEIENDEGGEDDAGLVDPLQGGMPIAEPIEPAEPAAEPVAEPVVAVEAADVEAAAPVVPNHEAPPAPARRVGLGTILSNVSNAIVSALILPGVSFAAGEALRLVLPKEWTAAPLRNPWMRAGSSGRLGLFQQQWGRSLVGGCLFIVLRDMLRVYTKTRKVAALSNRRVKNVDRPRRAKK